MVADASKVWGTDSFWQFEGEVWWLKNVVLSRFMQIYAN